MNCVICTICENTFLSKQHQGDMIKPWDCPKCNKDGDENIQRDLNELFKINGLHAIDNVKGRVDRLDRLSEMHWRKDPVSECILLY